MQTPQHTVKWLFGRIHQHDREAFTLLFDQYWNILYSQAMVYLKDAGKAQDIVQEVFLQIWQHRDKLDSIDNPEGYLFIIARNRIVSALRKKVSISLDSLADLPAGTQMQSDPNQLLYEKQVGEIVQAAIRKLPPQRRAVFELSRHEGLKYEEIAQRLGISRETVKVQMVKALSFIRKSVSRQIALLLILWFK